MKSLPLLILMALLGPFLTWHIGERSGEAPTPLEPPPSSGRAAPSSARQGPPHAPETMATSTFPAAPVPVGRDAGEPVGLDSRPGCDPGSRPGVERSTLVRAGAPAGSEAEPPRSGASPCAGCERLSEQVAYLTRQVQRLEAHGGRDPFRYFLASGEGEGLSSTELDELEALLGYECPFYLQPGEAAEVLGIERGERPGPGSSTEQLIRFLGPRRVLDEAPDAWLRRTLETLGEDDWVRIFGVPPPASRYLANESDARSP